jgi:Glycosyl hydrolases family 2, TIM barrel domain/Glycosyl hydrolases family 2
MINRRNFLGTLGASVALTAVPAVSALQSEPVTQGSRSRLSLNGEWEYRIEGKLYETVVVPSSRRPSGYHSLNRTFVLPRIPSGQRVFAHFEAITYWGRLTVNGKVLGVMGPYIPYEFEFTSVAREGENAVQVEILDLVPMPDGTGKPEIAMGINPGWEGYGGIIRDVWVETRPASFIENVRFAYTLGQYYSSCRGLPRVMVQSAEATSCTVETVLKNRTADVARDTQTVQLKPGLNEIELTFNLENPALWSPDQPHLYELSAHIKTASSEDQWSCQTGFRDIRVEGREFRLNGKKLVLNGVCRHDMWKDQGFTLTRKQQEQDMRMIKELGCNFIRLVHYPHDRNIIALANQLGLMVSEEPGFWNMDFNKMEHSQIELGYVILETTIRRDWNAPAVIAWLLSNECTLTEETLAEGKQRCNRLDPIHRLVSAANSHSAKKVKPMFIGAGLDFFDQHPYTYHVQEFAQEAAFDGASKPLTFTEWGGRAIGQTPLVMRKTVDALIDLIESGELSGTMFWSWQDLPQFSRIDDEMCNGILESGVVTEAREPRDVVSMELSRLFTLQRHVDEHPDTAPEVLRLRSAPWEKSSTFDRLNLQPLVESSDAALAWSGLNKRMAEYWKKAGNEQWKSSGEEFSLWPESEVEIAGVKFRIPTVNGRARPVMLTPEAPQLTIPVGGPCRRVHILGQVTLPEGFPVVGNDGETVATYTLEYAKGTTHEIPLRNGYEVARSNLIQSSSRIDPIATEAQPALLFVKDIAREQYQILLYSIPTEGKELSKIHCKLNGEQAPLAIFAVTVERAQG